MKIQNVINKAFVLSFILFATANLYSQGYEIKVSLTTKHYDSLHLQAFDGKKDFKDLQVLPYAKTVVFKGKKSLDPGIYLLEGDTVGITEILISDSKSQQFSITEKDSVIKFINSPENEANQQYMKEMREFDQRIAMTEFHFCDVMTIAGQRSGHLVDAMGQRNIIPICAIIGKRRGRTSLKKPFFFHVNAMV